MGEPFVNARLMPACPPVAPPRFVHLGKRPCADCGRVRACKIARAEMVCEPGKQSPDWRCVDCRGEER